MLTFNVLDISTPQSLTSAHNQQTHRSSFIQPDQKTTKSHEKPDLIDQVLFGEPLDQAL